MKQLITLSLIAVALLATGCNEEGKKDNAASAAQDQTTQAAPKEAADTKNP